MSTDTPTPPTVAPYRRQLRRVAWLLFGVALVDAAVIAYCLLNRIHYSSSLGAGSLIAGGFLLFDSLRAASIVRWIAAGLLPMLVVVLWGVFAIVPFDLLATAGKLHPTATAAFALYAAAIIALCITLLRALGSESILAARAAAGKPRRNLYIPAALGLVVASALMTMMYYISHGRAARHAEELAAAKLGPDYRYFTDHLSLQWRSEDPKRSYYAHLTAWNENEITSTHVFWDE